MAIAYVVTINKVTVFGDQRISYVTLTSPASGSDTYTTGGDSITPAQVGLDVIDFADCSLAAPAGQATAYVTLFTPGVGSAAGKLQLFGSGSSSGAVLAEVTGATAVASFSINCEFRGV